MIDKTKLKKQLHEKELGSFYKTVGGSEGEKCFYPTRLDTYGKGCYYDCKYCYAKGLLDFRGMWNPNDPAVPDIKEIINVIRTIPSGAVVRLGGMTDCFQPKEFVERSTHKTIQLLNKKKVHYLIVTKSTYPIRKEYLKLMDKKLAHIQISIATDDNDVLRATDNAPTYEKRVRTAETLQKEGFDVSLRLAPFLFETTNIDKINKIKVDKCLVEFLRINGKITKALGGLINPEHYTVSEGGYNHLPLQTKLDLLSKLHFKEMSVCDDVDEHYNYFLKNYNHNPKDCCNLTL